MAGISTSVGLISGINTADLIDKLMQVESRPVTALQHRVTELNTEKAAWMSVSASLLGLKTSVSNLKITDTFTAASAASSNKDVLAATASANANLGTFQFTVRRLVQSHQMITSGYSNSTSTPVGAGTITLETANGRLDKATGLDFLNGQQGVRRGSIRITDRAGASVDVNLTDAATLGDVLEAINSNYTVGVKASAVGDKIVLTDTTGRATGTISVAEIANGNTAADLGILGSATDAPLVGKDINNITANTSLDLLNDRNGIDRLPQMEGTGPKSPDVVITRRDGTSLKINLGSANTLGDVLNAINNDPGNADKLLTASISGNGNGITLTDSSVGGGNLVVADGVGSSAATQLGLTGTYDTGLAGGRDVIAGLNTVMISNLFGGAGATLTSLHLQDRSGAATDVDISSAKSFDDIVQAINDAGVGIQASLNEAGNGIQIQDTTQRTDTNLIIDDVTIDGKAGNLAAKLGIKVNDALGAVNGGNAQQKYISMQTKLSDLTPNQDFAGGSIRITNALGGSQTVNLGNASIQRVGDVIRNINSQLPAEMKVVARINDSGTGILLEDTSGGVGGLKVAEVGSGQTAAQLGIKGESAVGQQFIDGSFRHAITVTATDTLQGVADKINAAGLNVTASVINDGSSATPYRLVLSSKVSGSAGQIVMDSGGTGLKATTFVQGQDALVYLGTPGAANSVALTSSTNQMTGVMKGVTLDLVGVSDKPVSVTVSRDTDGVVKKVKSFMDSFNTVIKSINDFTKYDPDTKAKGALFGDGSVWSLQARVTSLAMNSVTVSGGIKRLSQVGFSFTEKGELDLDEDKFKAAFAADPTGVSKLFSERVTQKEADGKTVKKDASGKEIITYQGIGHVFDSVLDQMTRSYDGQITRITDGIASQSTSVNDRIKDLSTLLSSKRARLEQQFMAMESALAKLQSQQSSLTSLTQLATSMQS